MSLLLVLSWLCWLIAIMDVTRLSGRLVGSANLLIIKDRKVQIYSRR